MNFLSIDDRAVLHKRIRGTIHENFPKLIIAVVVMMIVSSLAGAMLMVPLAVLAVGNSLGASLGSLFIAVLSVVVTVFLLYGFFVMLGRFYRQEPAVIGHLFWGFRDTHRLVPLSVLAGLLALAIAFVVVMLATVWFFSQDATRAALSEAGSAPALVEGAISEALYDDTTAFDGLFSIVADFTRFLPLFLVPYLVVLLVCIFPYLFSFPILYHEPALPLGAVLKKSRQLLKKRKWALFTFCLSTAKIPLLVCAAALAGMAFLPAESGLFSLASNLYSVTLYFALIYLLLGVNAVYYHLCDPDTLCLP